jgi:hypothetical protein
MLANRSINQSTQPPAPIDIPIQAAINEGQGLGRTVAPELEAERAEFIYRCVCVARQDKTRQGTTRRDRDAATACLYRHVNAPLSELIDSPDQCFFLSSITHTHTHTHTPPSVQGAPGPEGVRRGAARDSGQRRRPHPYVLSGLCPPLYIYAYDGSGAPFSIPKPQANSPRST